LKREGGESKFRFKSAVSDATTLLKIARDNEIEEIKEKSREITSRLKIKGIRKSPGR